MVRIRATRHQHRHEMRTGRLEQLIDTLTELANTLVTTLGQNAANATFAISIRGSLLLTRRARKVYLLKRAGTSQQARPKQTPMHVEGVLGVDIAALGEQGMKMEEMHQSYMCSNTPGI